MKLAFIGVGQLGSVLAERFNEVGHDILVAHDEQDSLSVKDLLSRHHDFEYYPIQEAVDHSDLVFLVVPYSNIEDALGNIHFDNKVLVDCTNPIDADNTHALDSSVAGSEYIQLLAEDAVVVKAFSLYQPIEYQNIDLEKGTPVTMPIAGDDPEAKKTVAQLVEELGFAPLDVGSIGQSLHLEHWAMLSNSVLAERPEYNSMELFVKLI